MKDNVIIQVQGDLFGPPTNPEVELSQVRRQELQIHILGNRVKRRNLHKLYKYKETCTGSNSKNRVSKHDVHEPSVHDEGLPFPTKEVGNYSRILNISNGNIKDKCVDKENVHVLVKESSHSSWTEIFGEPGGLQEHELRGNSKLIQYHTEMDIGAFWRNSECAYD